MISRKIFSALTGLLVVALVLLLAGLVLVNLESDVHKTCCKKIDGLPVGNLKEGYCLLNNGNLFNITGTCAVEGIA